MATITMNGTNVAQIFADIDAAFKGRHWPELVSAKRAIESALRDPHLRDPDEKRRLAQDLEEVKSCLGDLSRAQEDRASELLTQLADAKEVKDPALRAYRLRHALAAIRPVRGALFSAMTRLCGGYNDLRYELDDAAAEINRIESAQRQSNRQRELAKAKSARAERDRAEREKRKGRNPSADKHGKGKGPGKRAAHDPKRKGKR